MTSDADRIIDLYQRRAHDWAMDRAGGSLFEKAWLDRFLALVPAKASILDLGCGSGEPIARYLIETGHDVAGVDSSSALIDICKTSFPGQNWMVADMRKLSLDRRFDGLIAWDSFFHLGHVDQRRMFPTFRMHAASKAALMFTTGPAHGEAVGNFHGEPLYHASLDPAEYSSLLNQNGFRVVWHVVEDPSCGRHTIWLAQSE
jgi:trans-aconitate methyltransferase